MSGRQGKAKGAREEKEGGMKRGEEGVGRLSFLSQD